MGDPNGATAHFQMSYDVYNSKQERTEFEQYSLNPRLHGEIFTGAPICSCYLIPL